MQNRPRNARGLVTLVWGKQCRLSGGMVINSPIPEISSSSLKRTTNVLFTSTSTSTSLCNQLKGANPQGSPEHSDDDADE